MTVSFWSPRRPLGRVALGLGVDTLRDWEQGRRLRVVVRHPRALREHLSLAG